MSQLSSCPYPRRARHRRTSSRLPRAGHRRPCRCHRSTCRYHHPPLSQTFRRCRRRRTTRRLRMPRCRRRQSTPTLLSTCCPRRSQHLWPPPGHPLLHQRPLRPLPRAVRRRLRRLRCHRWEVHLPRRRRRRLRCHRWEAGHRRRRRLRCHRWEAGYRPHPRHRRCPAGAERHLLRDRRPAPRVGVVSSLPFRAGRTTSKRPQYQRRRRQAAVVGEGGSWRSLLGDRVISRRSPNPRVPNRPWTLPPLQKAAVVASWPLWRAGRTISRRGRRAPSPHRRPKRPASPRSGQSSRTG